MPFKPLSAHDYETLMGALRERKTHLGLTNLDIDWLGQLPSGYAGKLFCGSRTIGLTSIGKILKALDVRLVVQPGQAWSDGKAMPDNMLALKEKRKSWGRQGGIKRWALQTPAQRSRLGRLGGLASQAKRRLQAQSAAPGLDPGGLSKPISPSRPFKRMTRSTTSPPTWQPR
jgi:hypothetical protein